MQRLFKACPLHSKPRANGFECGKEGPPRRFTTAINAARAFAARLCLQPIPVRFLTAATRHQALTLFAAFCAVLVSIFPVPPATAEPLRVVYGFDREFPPFTYEEPGGKAAGFEIELVDAVFHEADVKIFHRPMLWERVGIELANGEINLTTGMVRTEQRSRLYLFSEAATFRLPIRMFTKTYNRYPDISRLRGQTVGVEQASYPAVLLEQYGGFNIKLFRNRGEAIRALYNDEVQAYCGPVPNTYYLINTRNYGGITSMGAPLGVAELRAAFSRERGDVRSAFDEGLKKVIDSGEYDRLYRKWFVREIGDQEGDVMLESARRASIAAYAPYGGKGAGAAVLTATGKVYSACTMENADLSLTVSALRAAVAAAVAAGEYELRAAVLVDQKGAFMQPAPEDLQTLGEFGRGVLLVLGRENGRYAAKMTAEILPGLMLRDIELRPPPLPE
ncbi:MAG: transporter substrate-binding domain-containing protein [Desulfovibrio sp.]|jgi:cytidine deaminase|nr:transporter substrate-binding domain-containing protein [Desulfovibrio sp.]